MELYYFHSINLTSLFIDTYLAIILAARKMRILIIDLDSNCAISQVFGQVLKDYSSMDFLSGTGENFKGVYPAKEQIDIIPGSLNNMLLNNIMDRQLKINLKRAGYCEAYDYIIIDPPGYWGGPYTERRFFGRYPGNPRRLFPD
jgi:cellulose biosynthesis protein BcsQ